MTFGNALEYAKAGYKVYRDCLSWKGVFVYTDYTDNMTPYLVIYFQENETLPYLISHTDIFADDWKILGNIETLKT